ncbi:unnamed protein product [Closterium sp. Naga37s-1]|nr:unnamed protein product [Closterium sp. Naga37s-1]
MRVLGKGIVHDLTCPYTPQQNGMAEEMRTVVEAVRTMLLHMCMQHYWWHLALRQAVWVRNCLERSTLPPGTTPHQLLTGKKPNLTLVRVWGCMVQFMIPEQQRGGKLAPKARWGLHLGVSPESKGWEVLDLTDNKMVTTVEAIFYETLSLEVWKVTHWPASGRTRTHSPTDSSTAAFPLLAEVDEPVDEGVDDVHPTPPPLAPTVSPLITLHEPTTSSATGDEGSLGTSHVATISVIAGVRRDVKLVNEGAKPSPTGEQRAEEMPFTGELSMKGASAEEPPTGKQLDDSSSDVVEVVGEPDNDEGELSAGEQSSDSDMVEVEADEPKLRRSTRSNFGKPSEKLSYHVCLPPTSYSTLLDDAQADVELPKLDPDMHADPEHRWDIATMTYHVDDTVAREKARLVVKGFTQVYGADYDETYAPVGSYVTLRIFLSIVAVLDMHLMQLDMKNAFLQSKLNRMLYMYQPDYCDDGTGQVCKLLKSLYGLKQSPLLWYSALDTVLTGAGWSKSQVDEALYFKVADWVLVYVDDLLAASSSTAMLRELKELLEAAFELREISPVEKYLGLEIVRDRPARKLCLHQQAFVDKLRRHFINEEQTGRIPKTPVSVTAYAELMFDNEDAQSREEEEYRQKQDGERPDGAERQPLARGRPLPALLRRHL